MAALGTPNPNPQPPTLTLTPTPTPTPTLTPTLTLTGSLMSGFVLAHLYHTQQGLPPAAVTPGEETQEGGGGPPLELCAALRQLWASYEASSSSSSK